MAGSKNGTSLPLGVDVGDEAVSIVATQASSDGFSVREATTLAVPAGDGATPDIAIAQTLRDVLAGLATRERRAILAAPSSDVVTRIFRVPPGMRKREAERAAGLEADTIVEWPASERLVALDPIPGRSDEMLLSIGRASTINRIVGIARAAGLKPVAVDLPACAWRRAIPAADAVLDCTNDRATLVIFADPLGQTHVFPPRLIDDRLASGVRSALVDARREGVADVQRLAFLGTRFRYESIEPLLRTDGYHVDSVVLGDAPSPPWTFAYGLASWSVAPRGVTAS